MRQLFLAFWYGLRLIFIASRYRLDTIAYDLVATRRIRFALPTQYLPRPKDNSAVRFRRALERLGPIYIKFGQLLSTRRDLLPVEYSTELAHLQNDVPPFDTDDAIAIVENEFGKPLDSLFARFEREPLASASLAQVHAATLPDGDQVVVKVIRPNIEASIRHDFALLKQGARFLERISSDARRLHLTRVVDDQETTVFNELDLRREADNTSKLRYNFAYSELLYAPRVYAELVTENVLVMEHVDGVPISQKDELIARGVNLQLLAERGVETFFRQVFNDNFFHADMHPGNIFIDVTKPEDPRYIAIDCAIIGQLTSNDQDYLARNIVAFFNQDFKEIARLHAESNWIPFDVDVDEFEEVIRGLCEPMFHKPLSQISFGQFLLDLFQTARKFRMEIQPQLVLLQKTLLSIEGLGRHLYADLDLWTTAKPYMEKWMFSRFGPQTFVKELIDRFPDFTKKLPRLPAEILETADRLSTLERAQYVISKDREEQRRRDHARRRSRRHKAVAGTLFLVTGLIFLGVQLDPTEISQALSWQSLLGVTALLLALLFLLWR